MTTGSANADILTRNFEFWGGAIDGREERLELQLDAASLEGGEVSGVARLAGAHGCALLSAEGDAAPEGLWLRLSETGEDAGYTLEARREGDAYAAVLRRERGETHRLTLRRHQPGAEAPPPPMTIAAKPDDLPVNVTYAVVVDGRRLAFNKWSISPILVPIGTWSGTTIWGSGSGLVTATWLPLRGGNVTGQIMFTLSTWNPFSHVGYLYVNRWDVDDKVPVPIQSDSSVYWTDRWENVKSGTVTMHRNPR